MIRELEFQILCQRHRDEIFRYARGMLGNLADAEDATQEVLLRLWNHLPTVQLFKVRAWLYRTTRHLCLDQLRRRAHPAAAQCTEMEFLEEHPDAGVADPVHAADCTFQLEQAHALLQRLPEALRSVFVLYEVNGLKYREIAATLDLPINTVKVQLLRARQQLAKLAAQHEPWTLNSCKN